jgi:hypothetical protein
MSNTIYTINKNTNALILNLTANSTYQLSTFGIPMISYTSSNSSIATVNNNGVIVAGSIGGTAIITGTVNDDSKVSDTIAVNVFQEIGTYDDLLTFAQNINNGNINSGCNIRLTADIDISNKSPWIPIGSKDHPYTGIFDSKDINGTIHSITGLTINYDSVDNVKYQGLFGYIKYPSVIMNLTVSGSIIISGTYNGTSTQVKYCSGIVSYNNSGTVNNCTNNVSISSTPSIESSSENVDETQYWNKYIGGVCGYNNKGLIKNNTNNSNITGRNYVAGICGYNNGNVETNTNKGVINGLNYVSGICGYSSGNTLNSSNTGNITAGENFAGGINGYLNKNKITNCTNTGTIGAKEIKYKGSIAGFNGGTIE